LGGGQNPRPGEISLAHNGVLFFDEIPEYHRSTLEALRQPLEDKCITVARAKDTITYPADFMFVATSNPCPCGYYGSSKACSCQPFELSRYQRRLSGPILDRIDLHVEVDEVQHAKLLSKDQSETSDAILARVLRARDRQAKRYNDKNVHNANLTNTQIKKLSLLSTEAKNILDTAAERLNISARSYMKTVKVGRTIADLNNHDKIELTDITEALQYRRPQS
jgi:magnesium chelatase family protein